MQHAKYTLTIEVPVAIAAKTGIDACLRRQYREQRKQRQG